MRQIREMTRMMLKLLFQIDLNADSEELSQEMRENAVLRELLELVEEGRIDEAENGIYALCEGGNTENLKTVLLFYDYLNGKSDEFLEQHGFTREELQEDLKDLISGFGLSDMAEMFLREV